MSRYRKGPSRLVVQDKFRDLDAKCNGYRSKKRRVAMRASGIASSLEHDYLRVLYELAGKEAKHAVSYGDVRTELGRPADEVDEACDFWADRGMVEWTTMGHVALTHMGLRRARRLAGRGWSRPPF